MIPIVIALHILSLTPEDHYRYLIEARNPFGIAQDASSNASADIPPQDTVPDIPALRPEVLSALNGLKGVVLSKDGAAMALVGTDMLQIGGRFMELDVTDILIDGIVLENEWFRVRKTIGQPVDVIPIHRESGENDEGENRIDE